MRRHLPHFRLDLGDHPGVRMGFAVLRHASVLPRAAAIRTALRRVDSDYTRWNDFIEHARAAGAGAAGLNVASVSAVLAVGPIHTADQVMWENSVSPANGNSAVRIEPEADSVM